MFPKKSVAEEEMASQNKDLAKSNPKDDGRSPDNSTILWDAKRHAAHPKCHGVAEDASKQTFPNNDVTRFSPI